MPLSDVYDIGCVFSYHVRGRSQTAGSGAGHVRDRPRDRCPGRRPNAPRPESPTSSAGRGAVLADAPARRECALAYRVTVDAVLARAAPDPGARRDGDSRAPDGTATRRPDMAERHPGRYARPPIRRPALTGRASTPGAGSAASTPAGTGASGRTTAASAPARSTRPCTAPRPPPPSSRSGGSAGSGPP
jgi:hypothetical protein